MKKLIIILITLFFLTGCYNYKELQDLGIASSILIDYDTNYKVSVEILEKDKSKILKGTGETIVSALDNAMLGSEKELYYNHLNAILITDKVKIDDIISYFLRNPNINTSFFFIVTENADIYKENDLGKTLTDILLRLNAHNFFEISKIIKDKYQDLVLPYLSEDLKIDTAVAFDKNFNEVYKLNNDEVNIYKILNNKNNSFIRGNCNDDKYLEISVNELKSKYKITDKITISIELEAAINDYTCEYDTTKIESIEKIESIMNETIQEKANELINNLIKFDSDILGINRRIYAKNHNLDKDFKDYEYEIDVKVHINKKGLLLK